MAVVIKIEIYASIVYILERLIHIFKMFTIFGAILFLECKFVT